MPEFLTSLLHSVTHDRLQFHHEQDRSARVYIVLRLKQREDDSMGWGTSGFGWRNAWIIFLVLILLLLGTWGGQIFGV